MKFTPTQKQLHAQAQANYGLFEAPAQAEARRVIGRAQAQVKEPITQVQDRVTMSESREWLEVKATAASSGAYRVKGWEGMNFSLCKTFGKEAGTLRNVARCDADGVCY